MGAAFFVGTYIHEVQSWVRGVIVMDKTAFFSMPSGLYAVSYTHLDVYKRQSMSTVPMS